MKNMPKSPDDLTEKERSFFDLMMGKIFDGELVAKINSPHLTLDFPAPADFTESEFDRVGHCLTVRNWVWKKVLEKGVPGFHYLLFPCGVP